MLNNTIMKPKYKKVGKWVPLCYTYSIGVTVLSVLNLNSIDNKSLKLEPNNTKL